MAGGYLERMFRPSKGTSQHFHERLCCPCGWNVYRGSLAGRGRACCPWCGRVRKQWQVRIVRWVVTGYRGPAWSRTEETGYWEQSEHADVSAYEGPYPDVGESL